MGCKSSPWSLPGKSENKLQVGGGAIKLHQNETSNVGTKSHIRRVNLNLWWKGTSLGHKSSWKDRI